MPDEAMEPARQRVNDGYPCPPQLKSLKVNFARVYAQTAAELL